MTKSGGKQNVLKRAASNFYYCDDSISRSILAPYLYLFPENNNHPEDQVKMVREWIAAPYDTVIATNSLIIVYALNNSFLKNKNLEIKAFEVLSEKEKINAMQDGWINETILGHVGDELTEEMNNV